MSRPISVLPVVIVQRSLLVALSLFWLTICISKLEFVVKEVNRANSQYQSVSDSLSETDLGMQKDHAVTQAPHTVTKQQTKNNGPQQSQKIIQNSHSESDSESEEAKDNYTRIQDSELFIFIVYFPLCIGSTLGLLGAFMGGYIALASSVLFVVTLVPLLFQSAYSIAIQSLIWFGILSIKSSEYLLWGSDYDTVSEFSLLLTSLLLFTVILSMMFLGGCVRVFRVFASEHVVEDTNLLCFSWTAFFNTRNISVHSYSSPDYHNLNEDNLNRLQEPFLSNYQNQSDFQAQLASSSATDSRQASPLSRPASTQWWNGPLLVLGSGPYYSGKNGDSEQLQFQNLFGSSIQSPGATVTEGFLTPRSFIDTSDSFQFPRDSVDSFSNENLISNSISESDTGGSIDSIINQTKSQTSVQKVDSQSQHIPSLFEPYDDESLLLTMNEKELKALDIFRSIVYRDRHRIFDFLRNNPHAYYRMNRLRSESINPTLYTRPEQSPSWSQQTSENDNIQNQNLCTPHFTLLSQIAEIQAQILNLKLKTQKSQSSRPNLNPNSPGELPSQSPSYQESLTESPGPLAPVVTRQFVSATSTSSNAVTVTDSDSESDSVSDPTAQKMAHLKQKLSRMLSQILNDHPDSEQGRKSIRFFLTARFLSRFLFACDLDPYRAKTLLDDHMDVILKLKLHECPDQLVIENYSKRICHLAGRDKELRPMVWIKFNCIEPGKIPINVGTKSTWLSFEAAIQDIYAMRKGIRLVYDFNGTGMQNVESNPLRALRYKDAVFAVAFSHPSKIKYITFMDAPPIVEKLWNIAKPACPKKLTDAVSFVYTKSDENSKHNWYESMCHKSQLPKYLGGSIADSVPGHVEVYHDWLIDRVRDDSVIY